MSRPLEDTTPRLGADFFDRPVLEVAPDLLGCVVTHAGVSVRLSEVEAYDGARDPGSHAYKGPTRRNATMFGAPGGLYVYFTYGMHHCANLVCREPGWGAGCLLRAGEVVAGLDTARERATRPRRGADEAAPRRVVPDRDLARGPARLARALGLGPEHDGVRPVEEDCPVRVNGRQVVLDPARVRTGPRVGLSGPGGDGTDYPWRFWIDGDPTVSVYRPAVRRRRRAAPPVP
ncbi:DNA-3-methyladenine glycosylase [Agilicoccus flavus]|uniref:DNA-3-methyladenine glycosylase n=1 Tax=Agilicoccus flavus TaxID=2775968 RepID=UPI001CF66B96|nr:DNA-3-methyladenine glycosylase [Agilicoccus flavus]